MIHLPNVFEIMKGSNAAIAECVAIFSGILCSEVLIFLQSSLEKTSSFQFIIFILEGLPNDVKEIGDANWFQKDFFSHAKASSKLLTLFTKNYVKSLHFCTQNFSKTEIQNKLFCLF